MDSERTEQAINLILEYGYIDGAHHKQWLLDQVLRVLAGERYDAMVAPVDDVDDWDTGIAP